MLSMFTLRPRTNLAHYLTPKSSLKFQQPLQIASMMMTSFTVPFSADLNNESNVAKQHQREGQGQQPESTSVTVNCPSEKGDRLTLSRDQLLDFPAFKIWFSSLQKSLAEQKNANHEFHKSPYILRKIDIQAVDYFGGGRLGFIKMKADVSNDDGESLPGSILLRGGSVAMLLILQPDDVPAISEDDKYAIMTVQPRIPAGTLKFAEIPAGMLDDSGTFAGGAAKEIYEETGLSIPQEELIDMTALALTSSQHENSTNQNEANGHEESSSSEDFLQKAVYPSPGGSDEFIPIFLCQKRMPRKDIEAMQGRLTGNRNEKEKITLKIVPLNHLWREGLRDGKTLAAWALYAALKNEGRF